MKIYEPKPIQLVRVQIKKSGDTTHYLTFCETDLQNAKETLQNIIAPHLNPFETGRKTSIDIREAEGGKNGKSVSVSFNGLSTSETMEIILKHFNK